MSADLELLRQWRTGDDAAGEALIRKHYPLVFKLILGQVGGSTDLAADLTQSVFELVLEKRNDIVENVGAYARGIARRKVIEHFRRLSSQQTDPAVSRLVESEIGAVSLLVQDEDARLLTRALRSLSIEDQQYLLWTYAEGWSQLEIAEHTGLTRPQVNGHIDRARQKLRQQLERMAESKEQQSQLSQGFDTWVMSLRRDAPQRSDDP